MIADSRRTFEGPGVDDKTMDIIKEEAYSNILQFLSIEAYPFKGTSDFKEVNVSDLVLYTSGPFMLYRRLVGGCVKEAESNHFGS